MVWIYYIWFNHLLVNILDDPRLGLLQMRVLINICVQVFVSVKISFLWDKCSGVQLVGHYDGCIFLRTLLKHFPEWLCCFIVSQQFKNDPFFCILSSIWFYHCLKKIKKEIRPSDRYLVITQCGSNLHFPSD